MKKNKAFLAAAVLVVTGGMAQAADMYGTPPYAPAVVAAHRWMGPYVGGNIGYQWGRVTNNPTEPSGISGGLHGGYNWQSGQFVLGGEVDFQFSDADETFAPWKFHNPWFSTLRARAGIAMNNILFYGTVGFAVAGWRGDNIITGASESQTHTGWAAGLGAEVGLMGNWSARAEYLYMDLAERGYPLTTGANNGMHMNLLRFGVSYHF